MALARVVTFDGVTKERMDELTARMSDGEPPEGFPSAEFVALHDPEAEQSLVIMLFENEDDYRRGDEILSAMPAEDTPGRRASVKKYEVAMRMSS